ncbi:ABC transporter family substrate-binding protein [Streptosporangium sp. NPDC051022]|uniref:ABC transporter family substrate-binding protein n=1 Tax=Streptosporangium sp. NPDC051022 TaxID=3155752 RepID=UPI0034228E54
MHTIRLAAVAGALILAATACVASPERGTGDATPGGGGGTVTVATIQAWTGLNPHVPTQGEAIGLAIGNLIYPSAFAIGPDLGPALNTDLLVSAEVTSTEPQTVVYKIKPTAVWSDGTPITAADFDYLWRHMSGKVPGAQTTGALGYDAIRSVTGGDGGKTVTVVFAKPFGEWRSLFTRILPAHFMATRGAEPKAWNEGLIKAVPPTGGPFVIAEDRQGQLIRFARNPRWPGERARSDALVLRFVKEPQAVIQALAAGEVDIAALDPDQSTLAQLRAVPSVTTELVASPTQQFLGFQFGRRPASEPVVRQAVATALDLKAITVKTLGVDGERFSSVNHIYSAGSPGYTDNLAGRYGTGDAAAAAALLEGAGYTRGGDGYFAKGGKPLTVRHALSSGGTMESQLAVLLQGQLKAAGIKLDVVTVPDSVYFDQVLIPGNYDTISFGYPGSAYPISWYEALYTCKGGYNFQRFCDPGIDRMFAEATKILDEDGSRAAANAIDAALWKQLSLFPLFSLPELDAHSTRIQGYRTHPLFEWRLAGAASWSGRS